VIEAIEMSTEIHCCTIVGNLERIKQLVEGGADLEEINGGGETALSLAISNAHFEIMVYLVEHGSNVANTDNCGMTPLHWACIMGSFSSVKYLLDHGARITDRDSGGMTALLYAARSGHLKVSQHLLSSEVGASMTETDIHGNTALLLAAGSDCHPPLFQWLLEHGGAQITNTNNAGETVWTVNRLYGLPNLFKRAYMKDRGGEYDFTDGKYVSKRDIVALTSMLRVIMLHGEPPASLVADLAPPLQQIVQDGARLRARLPAYLARRRAFLDAKCPLLPPLRDLVHGYEEPTTTDELWATGLGAPLQRTIRQKSERGQSPERRSARLRQKRQ
jgi:hypothetical protein